MVGSGRVGSGDDAVELSVPGHSNLIIVGQGLAVLTAGATWRLFWMYLFIAVQWKELRPCNMP